VQVQDEHLGDIISLELAVYLGKWICEDMPKERLSHSGVWGSNSQVFNKQVQSRKMFQLEVDKIVIIKLKWNMRKAKV